MKSDAIRIHTWTHHEKEIIYGEHIEQEEKFKTRTLEALTFEKNSQLSRKKKKEREVPLMSRDKRISRKKDLAMVSSEINPEVLWTMQAESNIRFY